MRQTVAGCGVAVVVAPVYRAALPCPAAGTGSTIGGGKRRHRGFLQFYRIGAEDEYTEPNEPNQLPYELKACGLHSVAGVIIHIAEKTGWSYRTITRELSFKMLRWMLADAPTVRKIKRKNKGMKGSDLIKLLQP